MTTTGFATKKAAQDAADGFNLATIGQLGFFAAKADKTLGGDCNFRVVHFAPSVAAREVDATCTACGTTHRPDHCPRERF